MSGDFRDIIRAAIEQGFLLDKCGTDERQKMWGRFNDFCGMSVADALAAQSGGDVPPVKRRNVITLSMQNNGSGSYYLAFTATYEPTAEVVIEFFFDGIEKNITMPAGQKMLITDIQGNNPEKPYATIEDITISSLDETYTYSAKNSVKTGIFTLTIIKDGVTTTQQVKCGDTVDLGTAPHKEGYDFIWRTSDGTVIVNGIYIMTDGNSTVSGNYEKSADTIRIFYASVPKSGVTTFDNFDSMGYVDYTFGEDAAEISFIVPAASGYNEAAAELDETNFAEWLSEHIYDFYIMVPYSSSINAAFENVIHTSVTDTFEKLSEKVTYNNKEYTVYYRQNQAQIGVDSEPMAMYVSANR